jgi:hypothetical protein
MIPCQTVSEHLWDWLHEGAGHPLHSELDAHVAGCATCRAQRDTTAALRSTLKATAMSAPPGFAERLQADLAQTRPASRFEPDPWLEEAPEPAAAVLVDRRHPAWWRPLALVAGGAAAVLVFGLFTRRPLPPAGLAPTSGSALVEQAAPAPSPADSATRQMAAATAADPETGLLAERPYEEDSSKARSRQPEGPERLTPVGATP